MKIIRTTLLIFLLYFAGTELAASRKADNFCQKIEVGGAAETLVDHAVASGARASATQWQENEAGRELPITFTGFIPGSDFICLVKEANGSITHKEGQIAKSLLASNS